MEIVASVLNLIAACIVCLTAVISVWAVREERSGTSKGGRNSGNWTGPRMSENPKFFLGLGSLAAPVFSVVVYIVAPLWIPLLRPEFGENPAGARVLGLLSVHFAVLLVGVMLVHSAFLEHRKAMGGGEPTRKN